MKRSRNEEQHLEKVIVGEEKAGQRSTKVMTDVAQLKRNENGVLGPAQEQRGPPPSPKTSRWRTAGAKIREMLRPR